MATVLEKAGFKREILVLLISLLSRSHLPYNTEESTPPLDNTHPYMSTPGNIYFVSFFDHHFITGGALNTIPPTGNA